MNRITEKKISIKTRILVSILILLSTVFLSIVILFNISVNSYIQNKSNEQLSKATEVVENFDDSLKPLKKIHNLNEIRPEIHNMKYEHYKYTNFMRGIQSNIKLIESKSDAEVMVIDNNCELVFPNRDEDYLRDIDKYESILEQIKIKKINLKSINNIEISAGVDDYYVSAVKINSLDNSQVLYAVLFIDVSNTLHLAQIINIVLIIVMCISGVLAIFTAIILSNQIAKPIQKICEFARNIGQGNFEECNLDFSDKELDELSQVMNKSVKQLDKYDKEQKIFFQNASHELRTPLMSIKGYAEAIKYNVIDKNSASDIILDETNRLADMVEDLLYISKMDNITKDYISVECDLREVLSNCILKQKARAINKGIEFKYDFDENEVLFNCDEKSLTRAFLNLIENALRYSKSSITVGCKNDIDKIIIYIEDDGDGIKENDLDYIFDRFYKGNKGKHGIGLSIVKSIIEKHDGKIYAENGNVGARFTMFFKTKNSLN